MAARRIWTEHSFQQFLEMLAQGLPRDVIAARLGKTVAQIESKHRHTRARRMVLPDLKHVAVRKTPVSALAGREAEIAEMSRKGLGSRLIGQQLGVTPGTVSGFMQRRGLCANPRRHGPPPQTFRLAVNLARIRMPERAAEEADVRLGMAAWRQFEEMAG